MSKVIQRKLVIVGDGACGKTSLLTVFAQGDFPQGHVPTVFDNMVKDFDVDGQHVELALYDTAGQEDYDRLRPLSYPDTHVLLITFAIDLPDSLENITEKWLPEVLQHCPGVPYLLVACKKDLREDSRTVQQLARSSLAPISYEQGLNMSQKIGAADYIECSAKSGDAVEDVFAAAVRATNQKHKKKQDKCVVM
ncbi:Rho1 GTPase [Zychaea mexicana]|uniref:Rho1 GTPase n=1 Tax=Zychaea mexicana TaxID=64656 RepID=UPI0022FE30DD|nr:Rho1 GTPase [Zychaea mexicana]KAI9491540.1 Rho1 GTPase [Zychaea mexicana]